MNHDAYRKNMDEPGIIWNKEVKKITDKRVTVQIKWTLDRFEDKPDSFTAQTANSTKF